MIRYIRIVRHFQTFGKDIAQRLARVFSNVWQKCFPTFGKSVFKRWVKVFSNVLKISFQRLKSVFSTFETSLFQRLIKVFAIDSLWSMGGR